MPKPTVDVFLSYSRDDRSAVEPLIDRLEARGLSVWSDRQIPAGESFDELIDETLASARCVLVLWSPESAHSRWVRAEAEEGAQRHALVPAIIRGTEIPLGFRQIQTADLRDWDGTADHPALQQLLNDIGRILESEVPPTLGQATGSGAHTSPRQSSALRDSHQIVSAPRLQGAVASLGRHPRLLAALATIAAILIVWITYVQRAAESPRLYSIATGSAVTGTYYSMAHGLASVVEREMPGAAIKVLATRGSLENVDLVDRGQASLALAQSDVAFHAVKTDRALGHRSEAIVGLAALFDEYLHVMVRTGAGLASIAELPGHRVSLSLERSGGRFTNQILLDHFGIELEEKDVLSLSSNDANVGLLDGTLGASLQWFAAPHFNIIELLRSGEARLLAIDPELARGLQTSHPFLLPGQIPAGTYPNQSDPIDTVVVRALLVGNASLPNDFVTDLLDILFGNVADLIASHPRAAGISAETAFGLENGMSIDLHPAASSWWLEHRY